MRTVALIPAYKPSYTLNDVVMELKKRSFDVVVIDDGSGHKYDDIFEVAGAYAKVLSHKVNKGKGEALKTGLAYIKNNYEAPFTVVTADCDGQHRVEDIIKVASVANDHPDSLVLGRRELDKSAPLKSRLGNGATRLFYHLTTGRKIYETQTGLRGFSDRLIDRYIALPGRRYEYEMEVMLISSDIDIIETEIQTVYLDNNAATHFHPVKDTLTLWREFIRYKIPSLLSAAVDYIAFVLAVFFSGTFLIPNLCVRAGSFLLKYILNRNIKYAEKAGLVRYLITALVITLLDTGVLWLLTQIGVNVCLSKFISGVLMVGVSIGMRMLFQRIHHS